MRVKSLPLVFECDGRELVGILHNPESGEERGVLFITGGPQYRAGSHRQFVLLARAIADAGYPVLRFDYHGMGDSEGALSDFQSCQTDVSAAIKVLKKEAGVNEVVLWGLCDAASASMMSVSDDVDLGGMVLVNPWVRSEEGLARSHMRHYYIRHIFSREFRVKLLSGKMNIKKTLGDFLKTARKVLIPSKKAKSAPENEGAESAVSDFREQMRQGLSKFDKPVLLILCGDDLTANEFVDYTDRDGRWRKLLRRPMLTRKSLDGADHTFSTESWRNTVAEWTTDWLRTL